MKWKEWFLDIVRSEAGCQLDDRTDGASVSHRGEIEPVRSRLCMVGSINGCWAALRHVDMSSSRHVEASRRVVRAES
jgi:hypothetical protein